MTAAQWNKFISINILIGYAIVIVALPLSNFFMSLGSFWLVGAWLLSVITDLARKQSLKPRIQRFTSLKPAVLLTALYALPVIGLLWTNDFKFAQWDLRMKLPILFMPFLLTTLRPLTAREFRGLLGIFLLSLSFAAIWCLLIYWHVNPKPYKDVREISVFISHIRFSLLLVLGLCIAYYEAWRQSMGKVFCIALSICFIYFLYVIGSMTGYLVLSAIIMWSLVRKIIRTKTKTRRFTMIALLIAFPLGAIFYVRSCYKEYFTVPETEWAQLETTSARGEAYEHTPQFRQVENGHYVMTHIAWSELYAAWAERSNIYPDSLDGRGHILKGTLIRYAASKGLKKDYDGIMQLSDADVRAIEQGITSVHDGEKSGMRRRLDNIFFELANYRAGGNPSGHSVFQRFEFWRAALAIISDQPWMGVGTGDVKNEFADEYEKMKSPLDLEHRLRAHNQYLTMWLTYGIFGLLFFLVVIVAPLARYRRNVIFVAFTIIAAMSFFTEDTLESQAGIMFFSFFYIFLLNNSKYLEHKERSLPGHHNLRYVFRRNS